MVADEEIKPTIEHLSDAYVMQLIEALAKMSDEAEEALELRDHYSAANVQLQQELDHYKDVLRKMLAAKGDHMTACDKTMGDTHLCTCGANEARELFQ